MTPVPSELIDRFDRIRRDAPDRELVFLPSANARLTAAALWECALRQRDVLARVGVGRDDVVLYSGGNKPDLLGLWLACRLLGSALMPADASTTAVELSALARRFGGRVAVIREGPSARMDHADPVASLPGLAVVALRDIVPAPDTCRGAAVLKLTSGSTGLPKATCTTERQLLEDGAHIIAAMDIRPGDCQIAAIPLSHAYGIGNLVLPLLLQGTPIVLRDAFVPHQFAADAGAFGVRMFPGVPFMFEHFAGHLPPGAWPHGVDRLISAGARLERSTCECFQYSFGVKIHSFYGTSETGGIAYDDSPAPVDEGTVGRPMPGVMITLWPEAGAPAGGGRVHVAGSAVSSGYAGGKEGGEGFTGQGFLTGDVGRFDASGNLVLAGRVSAFINVAGRKVQPDEVEAVLRQMPGVADVRVVGAADPARGQVIVACIVSRGRAPGLLEVRQFCAARLAAHKIPRAIVALDAIPLTERGKTDRRRLQSIVEERARGFPGAGVL